MKKFLIMASAALALTACTKQAPQAEEPATRSLVLYYSQTGATEKVAQIISEKTGAAIDTIVAEQPYDGDFGQTIARCQQEMSEGTVPALKALNVNLADYDTIYIGYPVWFGTYAPPVASLVKDNDFAGKVLIPFCTFGSGGLNTSADNLKAALPNATILPGYGVRNARVAAAPAEVEDFLIRSGIIAGEVEELPEFSEQQPITDETKTVFDAACGSYSMPLGSPVSVGTRTIAAGTEYQFVVESQGPDGTPAQATIFVIKGNAEGAVPEFTQVVR